MKNLIKIVWLLFPIAGLAQSNVGVGTASPAASAQLDVFSPDKGLLMPRVALSNAFLASPVTAPAEGLMIWNTNDAIVSGAGKGFYFWSGSGWQKLVNSNDAWNLTGNTSIDTGTNFLGTLQNHPLLFRVNNIKSGGIYPVGSNTFLGYRAGEFNNYSSQNFSGDNNTFLGAEAGKNNTTGRSNTYIGADAGQSSMGTFGNTAIGASSGAGLSTGQFNTLTGLGAGAGINTGSENVVLGASAGSSMLDASGNVYIGFDVAGFNAGGNFNTYVGHRAGYGNFGLFPKATSFNNVYLGDSAGYFTNGGRNNAFVGKRSGFNNQAGSYNVFLGDSTGYNNNSGYSNTYIGSKARGSVSNMVNATAIGANAYVTASNSVVIGSVQGQNGATQHINVGIGTTAPQYGLHVVTNDAQNFGYRQCIVVENIASGSGNTGEAAISFKNQGPDGTGNSQWMIGLNQTRNLSFAYGDNFAGGSITKMYIDSTGNVGIATSSPAEKLEVNGNQKLNGNMLRPATGATDMLPVCYGNITSGGSVTNGSGNFSATRTVAGQYEITIAGEVHNNSSYVTVITPLSSLARMSSAASTNSKLLVRIFDNNGNQADTAFYFVVYKP